MKAEQQKAIAEQRRKALSDYRTYLEFGIARQLEKDISNLEAGRHTRNVDMFNEVVTWRTYPKSDEQIELEKQLKLVRAQIKRIEALYNMPPFIKIAGPLALTTIDKKLELVINKALEKGYFKNAAGEDLEALTKALSDPVTYGYLVGGIAALGGAYAISLATPYGWAVTALGNVLSAGAAAHAVKDAYIAYLEVDNIRFEADIDPVAKKVAELLVAATEEGFLSAIMYAGGRAFIKLKKTDSPPANTKAPDAHLVQLTTCFVAGTPVLTPDGEKNIESFNPGDQILSRPENTPEHPIKASIVEEVFELAATILELRIGGEIIGTTAEHPFYVVGKGWVPAGDLVAGDQLMGHDDQLTVLESVTVTDRYETVYNLRVKQDHTYFVGKQSWGFSVWVHNTYTIRKIGDDVYEILDEFGTPIPRKFNEIEAKRLVEEFNKTPVPKGLTDAEKKKYFRNAAEKIAEEPILPYKGEVPPKLVERVGEIRKGVKQGGLDPGKKRVVAIAEIDLTGSGKKIGGKSIDEIDEIVGISGKHGSGIPEGWQQRNPGSKVATGSGEAHAEDNIIGLLEQYLEADPNISGTVKIYINHPDDLGPCHRCSPKLQKLFEKYSTKNGGKINFEYSY